MLKGFNILLAPERFPVFVNFLGVTLFFSCLFVLNVLYCKYNIQAVDGWRQVPHRAAYILRLVSAPAFIVGAFFYCSGLIVRAFAFGFLISLLRASGRHCFALTRMAFLSIAQA